MVTHTVAESNEFKRKLLSFLYVKQTEFRKTTKFVNCDTCKTKILDKNLRSALTNFIISHFDIRWKNNLT